MDNGNQVHGVMRSHPNNESRFSQVVIADIKQNINWIPYLQDIQVIIHLAARVHVMDESHPDSLAEFQHINVHATVRLAEQAALSGVKRFVYVSSIKVNGEYSVSGHPFSELDLPAPQDPYGISKWEAEQALRDISERTGMQVVILRPPLIYGPGVKANLFNLIKLVNKGIPLPFGSIRNKRSLIYVGNLVDALLTCSEHANAAGKTFLVGDEYAVSTPELCRLIASSLLRPLRLVKFNLTVMAMASKLIGKSSTFERLSQSLEIDSSKICNDLSWSPPYTIEQGFAITADWFKTIEK
jgi:nucleoside-diphosphate-sugar epimerase